MLFQYKSSTTPDLRPCNLSYLQSVNKKEDCFINVMKECEWIGNAVLCKNNSIMFDCISSHILLEIRLKVETAYAM